MLAGDWQIAIDCTTASDWSQMLDLFDDANLYQTWAYGTVRWGEQKLSHLVLKREGEVRGLAQVRIIRPTRLKFGIAYLRWGPLVERRGMPLDPEVAQVMAQALSDEYIHRRKLFLRILPNAFAGSSRAAIMQSAFRGFTSEPRHVDNTYRTFVLDLAAEAAELRKRLDKKWRNLLASAEKKDLKVMAGNGVEEYRIFRDIYNQMRARKTFETTVDSEEFERIQQKLTESQRMRILICEDGGRPVAGLVASVMGNSAIYLLGATSDDGLKSRGSYLLQWTLIQWLKENGFRWYDLGGIDPEHNPGVYHFKKGMSGSDVSHVNPFGASESLMSSAIAGAGLAVRHVMRGWKSAFRPPLPLNPQPSSD
jgi:lipid II:glycine glycyltransferase (peptidoglycan interpeptide bridge formation enzyme)